MSTVILVPYRPCPGQQREEQLARFLEHFRTFAPELPIIILEQSDDGRKFNRGQLLNFGFTIAQLEHPGCTCIFHDVDLLPAGGTGMSRAYASDALTLDGPAHLVRNSRYASYSGGVVVFSESQFRAVNGYPNDFWGWGGASEELEWRVEHAHMRMQRPDIGPYVDLEDLPEAAKRQLMNDHPEWTCIWPDYLRRDCRKRAFGLRELQAEEIDRRQMEQATIVTVQLHCHPSQYFTEFKRESPYRRR